MPLPQQPIQGDVSRVEQLASGLKRTGGTSGPLVQKRTAGRPTGSTAQPKPAPQQAQRGVVTDSQKQMYSLMARAEWVRQFWASMEQRFPSPETSYYRAAADRMADEIASGTYDNTANFEF